MMKKMCIIFVAMIIVLAKLVVFAVDIDSKSGQSLLEQGYTEQDIKELNAVLHFSEALYCKGWYSYHT